MRDTLGHGLTGHALAEAYVHQRTPAFWVSDD
jgi:hypothetical protein